MHEAKYNSMYKYTQKSGLRVLLRYSNERQFYCNISVLLCEIELGTWQKLV